MTKSDWPFSQPRNLAVISLRSIIFGGQPVLSVYHDADDEGWQFLGQADADEADAAVVSLAEMLQMDATLLQLADMPPGGRAWRTSRLTPWQRG